MIKEPQLLEYREIGRTEIGRIREILASRDSLKRAEKDEIVRRLKKYANIIRRQLQEFKGGKGGLIDGQRVEYKHNQFWEQIKQLESWPTEIGGSNDKVLDFLARLERIEEWMENTGPVGDVSKFSHN